MGDSSVQKDAEYSKRIDNKFKTYSGIEVKPVYTPQDLDEVGFNYLTDDGSPGQYPFTRGRNPLGYRQNPWIMQQYSGIGDAEETNKRYHFLLEKGQRGISVAFDLPTQIGYDSDNPMARGEVGKLGVAIDSLQDVETLFKGIPLDKPRNVSTTANSIGPIWLAMMIALAEKQGISPQKCTIRLQNDVLKEYIARGTYIYPPEPSLSMSTDVITYCANHYPHWFPMTVCGYHIRDAGANAAQEIAFTIADGLAYIDDVIHKGVNPESFISSLAVMLSIGMDFFEEIAKFRAMRRLWARTINERYSISDPNKLSFNNIIYTAGSSLTAQQPMNNIVRVTVEALGAALSGCETLMTSSYDEAFCTPTEQAVKMALRTQQIVAYETGVTRTIDPLAGSYYLESLTTKLETMARDYLHEVDKLGGAVKAIEDGYFQKNIAQSAYEINRQIEEGERVIVGVNQYVENEGLPIEVLKANPQLEEKQKAKLSKLRAERDNSRTTQALLALKEVAERHENVVPPLIQCVKAYVTIGEICDVLRSVYGEYKAHSWL